MEAQTRPFSHISPWYQKCDEEGDERRAILKLAGVTLPSAGTIGGFYY